MQYFTVLHQFVEYFSVKITTYICLACQLDTLRPHEASNLFYNKIHDEIDHHCHANEYCGDDLQDVRMDPSSHAQSDDEEGDAEQECHSPHKPHREFELSKRGFGGHVIRLWPVGQDQHHQNDEGGHACQRQQFCGIDLFAMAPDAQSHKDPCQGQQQSACDLEHRTFPGPQHFEVLRHLILIRELFEIIDFDFHPRPPCLLSPHCFSSWATVWPAAVPQ